MKNIKFVILFHSLITLTLLESCINRTSDFKIVNQKQISLSGDIVEDTVILNIIKPYKDSINLVMDKTIGFSDEILASYKPESPLTNFVTDALLEYGKDILIKNNHENLSTFAIVNSKGLRTVIPEGAITIRKIYEVMPFENSMTLLKLNGNQVEALFNHIVSEGGDGLSGATFSILNKQATDIKINNKPLSKNSFYWVIAPDYLAQGGDNYKILTQADEIIYTELKLRDLIIDKIKLLHSNNINLKAPKNIRITEL